MNDSVYPAFKNEQEGDVNWDDIRIFKAVIDHGSFSAAGEALALSQPTVGRHIRELQERLGVVLFERGPTGLELTAKGRALQTHAEAMADTGHAFAVAAQALAARRTTVRVACPPLIAAALGVHMGRITDGLDRIDVVLHTSTDFANLEKGEADIAIRNKLPPSGNLRAQSLGTTHFGVYCTPSFAEEHRVEIAADRLHLCPWIGFAEQMEHLPSARWLARTYSTVRPAVLFDSSLLILNAVRHGQGLAVLPSYIAAIEGLQAVRAPLPDLVFQSWLVSHADSLRNPSVAAVKARLGQVLRRIVAR